MKSIIVLLLVFSCSTLFSQLDTLSKDSSTKELPYFPKCEVKSNLVEQDRCTKLEIMHQVMENFIYPDSVLDLRIEGTIYVEFVVNVEGKISKVRILKGIDPLVDQAAALAVQKISRMNPGIQEGKPVEALFKIPIRISFDKTNKETRAERRRNKKRKKK